MRQCELRSDVRLPQGPLLSFSQERCGGRAQKYAFQHFWLCRQCCEKFTLAYEDGIGVLINRTDAPCQAEPSRFIAAA